LRPIAECTRPEAVKTYAFTAHFIGPGVSSTHRPFLAWARLTYGHATLVDLPELGMLLESRFRDVEIEVAARPLDA